MSTSPKIGDRISYDGAVCTIRYIGDVKGTLGSWLGVEWDGSARGKHDGSHKGVQYFKCLSSSPTVASFVRPSRPSDKPRSFLEAVPEKYASEARGILVPAKAIVISGKVAEEVGFDKIRQQQARLKDLKIVILDGLGVKTAVPGGGSLSGIGEMCPSTVELDLSRNLFTDFQVVVDVVSQLKNVKRLKLNGNRFQNTLTTSSLENVENIFENITELALGDTLLSWAEITYVASKFPDLTTLFADGNQLSSIPTVPSSVGKHVTILNLEYNDFTSLSCLGPLASIPLRTLHLKGNKISTLTPTSPMSSPDALEMAKELPTFPSSLHYVDLSYNAIPSWSIIDCLPTLFPGLTALRLSHNPIYERPDSSLVASHPPSAAIDITATSTAATDEAHMLTVARLNNLRTLNFVALSEQDRSNSEMFYLSRIARQLAAVTPEQEGEVLKQHPRYEELCRMYGTPDVVRKKVVSENMLEGRLVKVHFRYVSTSTPSLNPISKPSSHPATARVLYGGVGKTNGKIATAHIPKSFDVYAVQGVVGRLFGIAPLKTRLIWETGEWDPVGGFEDREGDSSEDEAMEVAAEKDQNSEGKVKVIGDTEGQEEEKEEYRVEGKKMGRWVKREVELREGPRMFGFVVDGLEARIRVEVREK